MLVGLAKPPLDEGDGTPLSVEGADGDPDSTDDEARRSSGIRGPYDDRISKDPECGKAGEREGGAIPGGE